MNMVLENSLGALAGPLDRIAECICELDDRDDCSDRARVLLQLRRISADVAVLIDELERATPNRGEPAASH